jgi:hypothetical protein
MVRHPYDRLLSWYCYSKPSNDWRSFKDFMAFLHRVKEGHHQPESLKGGLVTYPKNHMFMHSTQQKQYDLANATTFIRLEHFAEDVAAKLPFVRKHVEPLMSINTNDEKVKRELTDAEKDMIFAHSEEDFEAFGYDRFNHE